eukprot:scaffold51744_cov33-Tisochrysis_lutea.AAC.2
MDARAVKFLAESVDLRPMDAQGLHPGPSPRQGRIASASRRERHLLKMLSLPGCLNTGLLLQVVDIRHAVPSVQHAVRRGGN